MKILIMQLLKFENGYFLRIKKAGSFQKLLGFLGITVLWHVVELVSRTPPHHSFRAFLNPSGILYTVYKRDTQSHSDSAGYNPKIKNCNKHKNINIFRPVLVLVMLTQTSNKQIQRANLSSFWKKMHISLPVFRIFMKIRRWKNLFSFSLLLIFYCKINNYQIPTITFNDNFRKRNLTF